MKTYSILLLIAAVLALGSCSSAYRSAQTPDAVYYSPPQDNGTTTQSSDQTVVAANDSDAGNYVVYNDGSDNSGYYNDYFDNGYYGNGYSGLYSLNNYYMNYPYTGLGYSSLWNYSIGFPAISLGMNWGMPFGRWYSPYYAYGMRYSPFSYGMMYNPYNPWYAYGGYPYYGGGYPYYSGYYGYGGYGKFGNITPRPAISWGPRRTVTSGAARQANTSQPATGNAPRRVFTTQGQNTNGTDGRINANTNSPRRVFKAEPSEQPVNVNNNRTVQPERSRRVFRSERNTNTTPSTRTERRVEVQRPSQVENRTFQQPTRTFESSPSSSPSRSVSTPSRTFSPRGR